MLRLASTVEYTQVFSDLTVDQNSLIQTNQLERVNANEIKSNNSSNKVNSWNNRTGDRVKLTLPLPSKISLETVHKLVEC